jgi:heme/copper-type cytochrome/quinol oxidase subunit 2
MTGFVEPLIWLGVGTIWGLVFAAIFYLIARYLNTRDDRKGAKKGGHQSGG